MKMMRAIFLSLFLATYPSTLISNDDPEHPQTNGSLNSSLAKFRSEIREYWLKGKPENGRLANEPILEKLDEAILSNYDDKPFEELAESDLSLLFSALVETVFYTHDEDLSVKIKDIAKAKLRNRQLNDQPESSTGDLSFLQTTYDYLIHTRHFKKATRIKSQHPEIIEPAPFSLPNTNRWAQEQSKPATISLEESKRGETILGTQEVDIDQEDFLVASLHPDCGFSRNAMEWLASNLSEINAAPELNLMWAIPQKGLLDAKTIIEWNQEHPNFQLEVVLRTDDWPQFIDFSETPVFYLINEGELSEVLVGWPDSSQGERLVEALESL